MHHIFVVCIFCRRKLSWSGFGAVVDLSPGGSGRMFIALTLFAMLGLLSWQTMEPSKFRSLTWILLAFFAVRVVLGRLRSR